MENRPRKKVKKTAAAPAPPPSEYPRRLIRTVAVLYLVLAFYYAVYIPMGKGPDETAHLRYIEHLAQTHRLPVFSAVNPGSDYEFHQPPLYYALALPGLCDDSRRRLPQGPHRPRLHPHSRPRPHLSNLSPRPPSRP